MAATPWDRRRGLAPRLAMGLAVAAAALAAAGPASAYNDGWKSGTRGGDMQDFATWRGTSLGVAVGWAPWDSWSNMTGWFAGTNPKSLRARNPNVSIALGLFPTGGTLSACAAGQYDANFATIAGRLVAAGVGDAELRLGWEPGSTDRPWHAVGRPADQWKACFVSAAEALLGAGPDLRIAWHMNKKGSKGAVTDLWDGDVAAVVTNIGVSNYDDEYARFGTELSKGTRGGCAPGWRSPRPGARSWSWRSGASAAAATGPSTSSRCTTSSTSPARGSRTRATSTRASTGSTPPPTCRTRASSTASCSRPGRSVSRLDRPPPGRTRRSARRRRR